MMNRLAQPSLAAAMFIGAAVMSSFAQSTDNLLTAKLEVAAVSARQNAAALTAWKNRDARLLMSTVPADFHITTADGSVVTWQTLYDIHKLDMSAVKHIDRFVVTIEVESVTAGSAVVLNTQDMTRVVTGSDGKDGRSKTAVTHREIWKKVDGQWKMDTFTVQYQTREQLDDPSIKNGQEHFEIQIKLTDPGAAKP